MPVNEHVLANGKVWRSVGRPGGCELRR